MPCRLGAALHVGVGNGVLFLGDEVAQSFVHALVDSGGLIVSEHLLPGRVGPLRRIQRAFGLPLFKTVTVRGS